MFFPSASMTEMSSSPSRLEMNAMRRPSGDQVGNLSSSELFVSWVMVPLVIGEGVWGS